MGIEELRRIRTPTTGGIRTLRTEQQRKISLLEQRKQQARERQQLEGIKQQQKKLAVELDTQFLGNNFNTINDAISELNKIKQSNPEIYNLMKVNPQTLQAQQNKRIFELEKARQEAKLDEKIYDKKGDKTREAGKRAEARELEKFIKEIKQGKIYNIKQVKDFASDVGKLKQKERETREKQEKTKLVRTTLKIEGKIITGFKDPQTNTFRPDIQGSKEFKKIQTKYKTTSIPKFEQIQKKREQEILAKAQVGKATIIFTDTRTGITTKKEVEINKLAKTQAKEILARRARDRPVLSAGEQIKELEKQKGLTAKIVDARTGKIVDPGRFVLDVDAQRKISELRKSLRIESKKQEKIQEEIQKIRDRKDLSIIEKEKLLRKIAGIPQDKPLPKTIAPPKAKTDIVKKKIPEISFQIDTIENKFLTRQSVTPKEQQIYLANLETQGKRLEKEQINLAKKIVLSPINYGKSLIFRIQQGEKNPLFNDIKTAERTLKKVGIGALKEIGDTINFVLGVKGVTINSKGESFDGIIAYPTRVFLNYETKIIKEVTKGKAVKQVIGNDLRKAIKTAKAFKKDAVDIIDFVREKPITTLYVIAAATNAGVIKGVNEFRKNPEENIGRAIVWLFTGQIIKGVKRISEEAKILSKVKIPKIKIKNLPTAKNAKPLLITALTESTNLNDEQKFLYSFLLNKKSVKELENLINSRKKYIKFLKENIDTLPKTINIKPQIKKELYKTALVESTALNPESKKIYKEILAKLNEKELKSILDSKIKQKTLISQLKSKLETKKLDLSIKIEKILKSKKISTTTKKSKAISLLKINSGLEKEALALYASKLEELSLSRLKGLLKSKKSRDSLAKKIEELIKKSKIDLSIKIDDFLKSKKISVATKKSKAISLLKINSGLEKEALALYASKLEELSLSRLKGLLKSKKSRDSMIAKIKTKLKQIIKQKKLKKEKLKLKKKEAKAALERLKKGEFETILYIDLKKGKASRLPKYAYEEIKPRNRLVQVMKNKSDDVIKKSKKTRQKTQTINKQVKKGKLLNKTQTTSIITSYNNNILRLARTLIVLKNFRIGLIDAKTPKGKIEVINSKIKLIQFEFNKTKQDIKQIQDTLKDSGFDVERIKDIVRIQDISPIKNFDVPTIPKLKLVGIRPPKPPVKTPRIPKIPKTINDPTPIGTRLSFDIRISHKGKPKTIKINEPENKATQRAIQFIKERKINKFQLVFIGITKKKDIRKPRAIEEFKATRGNKLITYQLKKRSKLRRK